jgi:DNA-binding MarR family transcriptional regulator
LSIERSRIGLDQGATNITAPPSFTAKQGQYLAFIHAYTLVLGRPPAEADLQRHFRVTPPSVHSMVLSLERSRLIRREPGRARTSVCWSTQ